MYPPSSLLEAIQNSRRGPLAYHYDPVGRLQEYAGTYYTYDARGNLVEKLHNGRRSRFEWDLFNRLTGYSNDALRVSYQYDALGRRLIKQSEAHWRERPGMTPAQRQEEKTRLNRAQGCGATLYGWDGDTLAWEGRDDQTTHYVYEPGTFVPLAQAISRKPVLLHQQPEYAGAYDIDRDPLWTTSPEPDPVDALAWYHCDQLGTPQELTDAHGEIAWSAQYHAWGAAKEAITDAARAAGIRNPIRFQGQYLDPETGLHYNRHRYYDPQAGRFITKDPIGFAGGLNVYQYADNPVGWVDPLGLARIYRNAPYHGRSDTAIKSKAPANGQAALDNSVQVKETSPRRVGIDVDNNEIFILDKTLTYPNGDEEFHGHVRCWCDLHDSQKSALRRFEKSRGGGNLEDNLHERKFHKI